MKKIGILFFFLVFSRLVTGQLENIPLVTVEAEGSIKVKPDYVILALQISRNISKEEAIRIIEIFKSEDTKIRLFSFDEENIETSIIQMQNSTYVKEIFITINDISLLEKILLELNRLGYNEFHYFEYRVKDFKSYKEKTWQKAIVLAKEKAVSLARELGQSIGKAHTIEEIEIPNYSWYKRNKGLYDVDFEIDPDDYYIQPGYITITSKVRVSFILMKE